MARRRNDSSPLSLFAFQDIITSVTGILVLLTLILALELTQSHPSSATAATARVESTTLETLEMVQERIDELQQTIQSKTRFSTELGKLDETTIANETRQIRSQLQSLEAETERMSRAAKHKVRERDRLAQKFDARHADRQQLRDLEEETRALTAEQAKISRSDRIFFRPGAHAGKRAWLVDVRAQRIVVAPVDNQEQQRHFEGPSATQLRAEFLQWAGARCHPARDYFVLLVRPGAVVLFDDVREQLRTKGYQVGIDVIGRDQDFLPEPASEH